MMALAIVQCKKEKLVTPNEMLAGESSKAWVIDKITENGSAITLDSCQVGSGNTYNSDFTGQTNPVCVNSFELQWAIIGNSDTLRIIYPHLSYEIKWIIITLEEDQLVLKSPSSTTTYYYKPR